jgi:Na+/proline symporter
MVAMSLTGALIAAMSSTSSSVIAGLLTFYFVVTGMLTVRKAPRSRWIDISGVAVAVVVGLLAFGAGRDMLARGRPEAIPMFIFGAMAGVGAVGDVRMIRAGGLHGPRRIARHLWRLCFAMWVAAASFFWGPVGRVPDIINIPALLPIPVLFPIAVMVYWLWRIRSKKASKGIVGLGAHAEVASYP